MRLLLDPAVKEVAAAGGAAVTTASTSAQVSVAKAEPVAAPPASTAAPTTKAEETAKAPWMAVGDAKPEAKADATKPAAAAETSKDKADEKFTFKLPEGHSMEAAALDAFGADMKALGVNQDQAQKLLERKLSAEKESYDLTLAQINKQDIDWEKELRDTWGAKYAETGEKLKRVYDYIDPQGDLRKGLEAMRMAHNPVLNKALAKLIPLFEDPKLRAPSSTGVQEKDTRTPQEKLAAQYREQLAKGVQAQIPVGMKFTK